MAIGTNDTYTITIKSERQVAEQTLLDIMVTAVESGGSGYWGFIGDVLRDDDLNVTQFCIVDHEDMQESLGDTMTLPRLVTAIQAVLNDDIKFLGESTREDVWKCVTQDDAGYIDADAADVLVQVAVFGEIIYG